MKRLVSIFSVFFIGAGLAAQSAVAETLLLKRELSRAPAFELKTPYGDTVRYPKDALGNPTVLMFWPSWCPYSRALQPYVEDIWTDYLDAGVNVWTISIKETGDPVATMQERGLNFPLLLDGDPLLDTYLITRTPWLIVIDGQQRIVYTRPSNPPSPIHVAKDVRRVLNSLIGDKSVPMPASFPLPYDLHLKDKSELVDRTAPEPIPTEQWVAWVDQYIEHLKPEERRADIAPRGPLKNGKAALALAKSLWAEAYGVAELRAQAPYRAFFRKDHWIVLGQGLDHQLGQGLVLAVRADNGQVIRMSRGDQ